MRLVVRSTVALWLAAGALACSESLTKSQSVAYRFAGTWSEPTGFPGESLILTLATQDTTVTGTGTYSYEAQGSGTVALGGTASGTTIDFDVLFDYGQVMHFHGALTGRTRLQGIWYPKPVGDPVEIEFDKVR
jgi:hypothetical protein